MQEKLFKTEVWAILEESKSSRFKPPDINLALHSICMKMGVQQDDDMKAVLKKELDNFILFKKAKANQQSGLRNDYPNSDSVIFTKEEYEPLEDMSMEVEEESEETNNKPKVSSPLEKLVSICVLHHWLI